jgi:hypothetical protein
MNGFIARIFSGLLTVLHVIVVVGVILALIFGAQVPGTSSYSPSIGIIIFFFIYVVIVGFLTVVVSINENLTEMKQILEKMAKETTEKPKDQKNNVGRIEPNI